MKREAKFKEYGIWKHKYFLRDKQLNKNNSVTNELSREKHKKRRHMCIILV